VSQSMHCRSAANYDSSLLDVRDRAIVNHVIAIIALYSSASSARESAQITEWSSRRLIST
jgi:hypothetical protein